jgi:hypothetical protein
METDSFRRNCATETKFKTNYASHTFDSKQKSQIQESLIWKFFHPGVLRRQTRRARDVSPLGELHVPEASISIPELWTTSAVEPIAQIANRQTDE